MQGVGLHHGRSQAHFDMSRDSRAQQASACRLIYLAQVDDCIFKKHGLCTRLAMARQFPIHRRRYQHHDLDRPCRRTADMRDQIRGIFRYFPAIASPSILFVSRADEIFMDGPRWNVAARSASRGQEAACHHPTDGWASTYLLVEIGS